MLNKYEVAQMKEEGGKAWWSKLEHEHRVAKATDMKTLETTFQSVVNRL